MKVYEGVIVAKKNDETIQKERIGDLLINPSDKEVEKLTHEISIYLSSLNFFGIPKIGELKIHEISDFTDANDKRAVERALQNDTECERELVKPLKKNEIDESFDEIITKILDYSDLAEDSSNPFEEAFVKRDPSLKRVFAEIDKEEEIEKAAKKGEALINSDNYLKAVYISKVFKDFADSYNAHQKYWEKIMPEDLKNEDIGDYNSYADTEVYTSGSQIEITLITATATSERCPLDALDTALNKDAVPSAIIDMEKIKKAFSLADGFVIESAPRIDNRTEISLIVKNVYKLAE